MEASGKRYIGYRGRADEIKVLCFTDLHLMNKACAVKRLKEDIEKVRVDPNCFWLGGGDNAEFISVNDKRFDASCVSLDLSIADLGNLGRVGIELVAKTFEPIKHKCLGLGFGNHESSYERTKEQQHLHSWLCCHLGVPNLGYSSLFDIIFLRTNTVTSPKILHKVPAFNKRSNAWGQRIFHHHGAGGAQTPGGKLNRLIRFMEYFDADIYFVGHVHDQIGKRVVQIGANRSCTKLEGRTKLGIICGSYLETYAQNVVTYGEKRGYSPVPLGPVQVKFIPDKKEVYGEI